METRQGLYFPYSNITAELDLPKSDLAHFEDVVPLPFGEGAHSVAHADYQFVFLAHIALRRLLNRILQSIYGTGAQNTLSSTVVLNSHKHRSDCQPWTRPFWHSYIPNI